MVIIVEVCKMLHGQMSIMFHVEQLNRVKLSCAQSKYFEFLSLVIYDLGGIHL